MLKTFVKHVYNEGNLTRIIILEKKIILQAYK